MLSILLVDELFVQGVEKSVALFLPFLALIRVRCHCCVSFSKLCYQKKVETVALSSSSFHEHEKLVRAAASSLCSHLLSISNSLSRHLFSFIGLGNRKECNFETLVL